MIYCTCFFFFWVVLPTGLDGWCLVEEEGMRMRFGFFREVVVVILILTVTHIAKLFTLNLNCIWSREVILSSVLLEENAKVTVRSFAHIIAHIMRRCSWVGNC